MLEHIDIMECPCFVFLDLPDDKLISSVDDLDNEEYSIKKEDEDLVEFTCSRPTYYRDIRELRTAGKYRDTPMGQIVSDPRFRTRSGILDAASNLSLNIHQVTRKCDKRSYNLTSYLLKGLSEKVYSASAKRVVNTSRTILDLESLMKRTQSKGAVHTSHSMFGNFCKAAEEVEPEVWERVDKEEMRCEYRVS